jgi:hypothetical protein
VTDEVLRSALGVGRGAADRPEPKFLYLNNDHARLHDFQRVPDPPV